MASGTIRKYMDGNDTGWVEIEGTAENDEVFTGSIFYRKTGPFVTVRGYGIRVKTALSTIVQLTQLPSGKRPPAAAGFCGMTNFDVEAVRVFPMMLNVNGELYLLANAGETIGTNWNIDFSFTFMAD